jgi:galactose-1-phosphate uridylyltransferase
MQQADKQAKAIAVNGNDGSSCSSSSHPHQQLSVINFIT